VDVSTLVLTLTLVLVTVLAAHDPEEIVE